MRHLAQRRVGPALAKSAVLDLPICLGHFIVSRTASAERLLPSCCRRDVKPENIVIEGGKTGGRVYLVDFGGVQVSGHTTLLGVCVCGSVCVGVQVSGADLALFLCASCPPDTAASRPALTPASSHTDSACSALPCSALSCLTRPPAGRRLCRRRLARQHRGGHVRLHGSRAVPRRRLPRL